MDLEENADLEDIEGEDFGPDDELEDATINGEVCVICTGVVTERGVLDCCQHWFCYECIEQWAAFSSHCPICKLDFHSITFLPVDDTSEIIDGEQSSLSIEGDEWYIKEGEIDPLFFPANYISEENVKCLDGEGCKIHSGVATYGDSISDTSVACDSCENWYHAVCVDFDPHCNSAGGWICPRCTSDTGQVKPVLTLKDSPQKYSDIEAGTIASALPGDVSVSIDDGETAVVVSFHKGSTGNHERGKESEFLSEAPEMFPKDEKCIQALSPICEPISEERISSESNMKFGTNEEIKTEICDRSFALESKTDIVKVSSHAIDKVDGVEKQEVKSDNLVVDNSRNVLQRPIELSRQTTKRRYSEIMMEPVAVSKKAKLASIDIMNIVTEPGPSTSNKEKVTLGARTRKIMRNQEGEKKQPSYIVDKLQTEIKTLKESINDDSLLRAVRAVIATNKAGPSVSRTKKPIAQTGKARQNLMKKIYSTSTGRRRPAWQRDCEVEFWKYRCNSKVDQEKVENLQSILNLLKKGSTWSEVCQAQNEESKDSILSRVYLADASVLPRRDNIKPLSDVSDASVDRSNKNIPENGDKSRIVPIKKENKITVGKGSNIQEKNVNKSGETKIDKRKWALEVLARKNASLHSGSNQERSEDGILSKGNYPLLAKLPVDMRPVLAAGCHNKVPISVRQAQLYRITEHFLRRTNLTSVCRSAETELAVADAVNIEKDICERSNSKLVYLNLVSQSLRQLAIKTTSDERVETIPNVETTECVDSGGDVDKANHDDVAKASDSDVEKNKDSDIEKLLRMAGLLSDSPPNSPKRNDASIKTNSLKGETDLVHTEIKEIQHEKTEENHFECARCDHPESERDEGILENNMDLTQQSSISDQKEDQSIPKNSSVLVKSSENEALDRLQNVVVDGKNASYGETGDMKNCDKNSNANKASNDNSIRGKDQKGGCELEGVSCAGSKSISHNREKSNCSPNHGENAPKGEKQQGPVNQKPSDSALSISKKVEAYVKEHIRPLCKSGVINVRQYRWAVAKTTEKVMKYHQKEKSANFLIKEGDKVKKLAEQYVESAQKMGDL